MKRSGISDISNLDTLGVSPNPDNGNNGLDTSDGSGSEGGQGNAKRDLDTSFLKRGEGADTMGDLSPEETTKSDEHDGQDGLTFCQKYATPGPGTRDGPYFRDSNFYSKTSLARILQRYSSRAKEALEDFNNTNKAANEGTNNLNIRKALQYIGEDDFTAEDHSSIQKLVWITQRLLSTLEKSQAQLEKTYTTLAIIVANLDDGIVLHSFIDRLETPREDLQRQASEITCELAAVGDAIENFFPGTIQAMRDELINIPSSKRAGDYMASPRAKKTRTDGLRLVGGQEDTVPSFDEEQYVSEESLEF
ncbi:hypothetical protein P7C71_g3146, partial [Lecanoromycetidae sp. Uapishka_2]